MEIMQHVDVVGDDRIQAILDDPRNFNLRAVRAETLQDWIPDTGTYLAPNVCRAQHGVFRTVGLARSGLPAILRHRFFEAEDAERVVGARYIGLLIYDSEGDDYTFEISAGSEAVGAVRPWRHDNRRHLIVASRPTDILGGHIPFTVQAAGKGMCYLESVLFLPELPEPSSFAPTIERLSVRTMPGPDGQLVAEVHFITAEAATAAVEAIPMQGEGPTITGRTEEPERLHAITLHGVRPDTRYRVRVTAAERGGATAEADLNLVPLSPSPRKEEGRGEGRVPLELLRLGERDLAGMPLTFGVPLAQGKLGHPPDCLLRCEGEELPVQTRVHARWPDGSARWTLADLPCPQALAASPCVAAELLLRPREAGPATGDPAARGLHWRAAEGGIVVEGESVRVSVAADGPLPCRIERRADDGWREVFGSNGSWLEAELGNGLRVANGRPEALALEEAGPERAVIRYELPLADERGTIHFRSTVRLHIYARMPFVRVVLRTVVVSPALGPAFGSKDLSHLTPDLEYLRSAVAGAEGEATSLLEVDSLALRLPWHGAAAEEHWRVVHEHDRGYTVESAGTRQHREGHWPGFLSLRGKRGPLALCVKHFWQTCPKGISYDGEQLWLELLPMLSGEPLPDYDELWHKLYFWYDQANACYRLKAGLALTTEFLVGFPQAEEDLARWQEWLERPVVARPDLAYLNETAALLPIAAKAGSAWPVYEACIDAAPAVWQRQLDERHEYGFLNFGDTYSDSEWFWSNNEYDAAFCHYVEFLRGGDPRWTLLAGPTVRHLVDVDSCNDPRHPEQLGAQYVHMPGHVGGYLPPYFRSKVAGSGSVPSHSWVEGPALHYLLTGDETVRSVLQATGARLTRHLRYYSFTNARECGWHLIHLCGLAAMADDPRLLNAAAIIVSVVLEKQEPGGGWEHALAEAHCHCEPPRCRGEANFMTGVLMAGLRRYQHLTGDPAVRDAIVGGARWLVRRIYLPESGLFRPNSCPSRGKPSCVADQLIEGLATAYAFAPEPGLAAALRSAVKGLDLSADSAGHVRYGRGLSMSARYIPTTLHLLGEVL